MEGRPYRPSGYGNYLGRQSTHTGESSQARRKSSSGSTVPNQHGSYALERVSPPAVGPAPISSYGSTISNLPPAQTRTSSTRSALDGPSRKQPNLSVHHSLQPQRDGRRRSPLLDQPATYQPPTAVRSPLLVNPPVPPANQTTHATSPLLPHSDSASSTGSMASNARRKKNNPFATGSSPPRHTIQSSDSVLSSVPSMSWEERRRERLVESARLKHGNVGGHKRRTGAGGSGTEGVKGYQSRNERSGSPVGDTPGGASVYFHGGARLIETAEISLEALSTGATYLLFLLPYICLAVALWLDSSGFGVARKEYSAGQAVQCPGGICEWQVEGLDPANSFIKLAVQLKPVPGVPVYAQPTNEESEVAMYHLGRTVELRVRNPGDKNSDWRLVHTSPAVGETMQWESVRCSTSTYTCDKITLELLLFDVPGLLGWYGDYDLTVRLAISDDGVSEVPGAGALMVQEATFDVSFQSTQYLKIIRWERCILLLGSLIAAMSWCFACVMDGPRLFDAVPERAYLLLLLAALICWQNPIRALCEWFPSATSFPGLLLYSDFFQGAGLQLMWPCLVIIIEAQGFIRPPRKGPSGAVSYEGESAHKASLAKGVPHHHYVSDYFFEFIVFKLLYTAMGMAVTVFLCLLRHPATGVPFIAPDLRQQAYQALSIVSGVLTAGWVAWFARVAAKAGRALRGQPFMATRRQQLTYRVMLSQALLVVLLVGVGLCGQLWELVSYALRNSHTYEILRKESLLAVFSGAPHWNALQEWVSGTRTPPGELLFVTSVVLVLVVLFLPPVHSPRRKHDRLYTAMEHDCGTFVGKQSCFCLERACYLSEVAWQAYYDPYNLVLDDMVAPGRQDLSYLGLELVAYVYDEESETRAILCRGQDKLVLAFRGTARLRNIQADMRLAQVPLVNLRSKGRPRISIPRYKLDAPDGVAPRELDRFGPKSSSNIMNTTPRGSMSLQKEYDSPEREKDHRASFDGGTSGNGSTEREGLWDRDDQWGAGACLRAVLHSIPVANQALPRVHQGFWESYCSIRERVMTAIAHELQHEYKPLYITGHSLGGAMACLCAYDVATAFALPDPLCLYTYGAPRAGNAAFSRMLDVHVPHHFRVVTDGDLVANMPRLLGLYRHGGCLVVIDSEKYGNFIVAPTKIELYFGVKASTSLICHLLSEYIECLEACLEDEDLTVYMAKGARNRKRALGAGGHDISGTAPDWLNARRKRDQSSDD